MLTIFTPVYNRADMIGNLYESLLSQTSYDFEWLVIDDGSKDSTMDAVNGWIKENTAPFAIKPYQQENGGKHRAVNRAVQLARGDAFFVVDSDDSLVENAVESVLKWWKGIEDNDNYAGIAGLRGDGKGEAIGGRPLFKTYLDATNIERKEYGLLGDKAEVYKTSVLKKYPFPEFEGENFLTEAVVWDRIAYDGLKLRWFNQVIYLCDYLPGGLTSRGWEKYAENPLGWGCYIRQTCKIYHLDDTEKKDKYLEYYILTRDKLSDLQIMDCLGIDGRQQEELLEAFRRCIEKTISSIGKDIAVYGMGMRGRKLLKVYQSTDVNIRFVLDKKQVDTAFTQISLDENIPKVDAIIVTPKSGQDEIMNFLSDRTESRPIGYDDWKSCIGLGKDF